MNTHRAITRLLQIKRRIADTVEAEHAKIQIALFHAQQEAESAEQTWQRLAVSKPLVKTVADLEDHVTSVRLVRRIADAATKKAEELTRSCTESLVRLGDARREVSRYEMWLGRQEAERSAEARREERIREDEHAARRRSVA